MNLWLAISLIFLSILFVFSDATEIDSSNDDDVVQVSGGGVDGFDPARKVYSLGEVVTNGTGIVSDFILAEERTRRKDPANNFKYYTGGWNITNVHYWSSVLYSAFPLLIVAALWFLLFGFTLILMCCCFCCCPRNNNSYSKTVYFLSLVLVILTLIAVCLVCGVLFDGQERLHKGNSETLEFIVDRANYTVGNLRIFASTMVDAKNVNLERQFIISPALRSDIDQLHRKLNYSANELAVKTNDNSHKIEELLYRMRLLLVIVAAVMLALALLGSLSSLIGCQCFVSFLLVVGWFIVTVTLLTSAVFLLLHNVYSDTCTAMEEWVEHPQEHTAIDDILPCVDYQTANQSMYRSKEVVFQVVDGVNNVVSSIANRNFEPGKAPFTGPNYNQSGPLVPLLCNPFFANTTSRKCSFVEIDLANATQKYKEYICTVDEFITPSGSTVERCTSVGRLTPKIYDQIAAAIQVGFGIYHYGPFLTDLQDCSFVRQTMKDITNNNCPGLEKYSMWVYIELVMVSSTMMLSIIFWAIYTREKRQRKFVKDHDFLRRYPLVPPQPIPISAP